MTDLSNKLCNIKQLSTNLDGGFIIAISSIVVDPVLAAQID